MINEWILAAFAAALPPGFSLSPILAGHYPLLTAQDWSRDLCGNFRDGPDFARRGLGVIALRDGVPAAGASSYAVWDGGIEIQFMFGDWRDRVASIERRLA